MILKQALVLNYGLIIQDRRKLMMVVEAEMREVAC